MIGIICAMQLEADGILALVENKSETTIAQMKFVSGTLYGKDVVIVVCGVGKVNAAMCAMALVQNFSPELVLNSGVAGALSALVSIGDIVVAEKSVEHDMNVTALGDKQGEVSFPDGKTMYFDCDKIAVEKLYKICKSLGNTKVEKGTVASGDIFVSDRSKRLDIANRFNALACEMEGAAIGHVCYRCGVPYTILRAISDDLDENKGVDFVKFCKSASQKTTRIVTEFISAL